MIWLTALVVLLSACLWGVTGCGGNGDAAKETTSCGTTTADTTDAITTEAPETACPHSYSEASFTAATCVKDGSRVSVCALCQDTVTEAIPAIGHRYESNTVLATWTEDGEVVSVCQNCGADKRQILPAMEGDAVLADSLTEHVVARANGFVYLEAQSELIALGGIAAPADNNGEYYRFVAANRDAYPGDIQREGATMAGVTLRFRIYGGSFRLKAIRRTDFNFPNKYGNYSFDIYVGSGIDRTLFTTLSSPFGRDFESKDIVLPEGVQEVMICLPYNMGFTSLQIAVEEGAYLAPPPARTGGVIGLYGSSITQGYDAKSPSLTYAMQLCLALDADCMNFGLSGSARGEKPVINDICDKIRGAGLTAFILDYDWNINSYPELRFGSVHVKGYGYGHSDIYEKLREALGPGVPIPMLSRPYFGFGTGGVIPTTMRQCIGVIQTTCNDALAAGDSAVGFISGKTFFPEEEWPLCHTDKVHPSNKGHAYMMAAVKPLLERLLAQS
jgi:hypothetical protein